MAMNREEIDYLVDRYGNRVEFQDKVLRNQITEYQEEAADLRSRYEVILTKAEEAEESAQNAADSETAASNSAQAAAGSAEDAAETAQDLSDLMTSYTAHVQAQDQAIADNNTAQLAVIDQQTTDKVAAQVAAMQVIEGQTVIDSTLTVSGAAAEAAKVGTEITELKNDLILYGLSGNLIPFDYYSGDTLTNNGITFTKNADGSVSSSGTATGQARYYWINEGDIDAGIYTIGGIPDDAGNRSFGLQYAIGTPPFAAADFTTIYTDTDVTIGANDKISLRTWYYSGYVDTGHTWSVYLGSDISSLNNNYNPKTFVPIIYNNATMSDRLDLVSDRLDALETLEYADYLSDSFELGTFTSGGRPTESTTSVRTAGYISKPSEPLPVKVKPGYRAYIHYYNTDSSISAVASSGWLDSDSSYSILTEYNFYRYVVQSVPLAESISQDEILTYGHAIYHDISTPIVNRVLTLTDETAELDNRVTALEDGSSPLADYWQTYLASIEDDLKDAIYDLGNHGDSFYFFTDYHYDKNADKLAGGEQLYKVFQWLIDKIPARKIVNGGDILQTHATVDAALEELNIFYHNFHKFAPTMYNVIGNHDSNHYQSDARLTDGQMYQDLFAGFNLDTAVHLQSNMYYYFDNDTQKIRYIILNTRGNYTTFSADSAQHQWIIDTLNDAPTGYNIVVIPHWFFEINEEDATVTQLSSFGTLIKSLLDAYNGHTSGTWSGLSYDFSNAGGKVIAVITGHVHREYSEISAAGYPMIGFICDAVNGSAQLTTRTIGTYTEHSVSLITINTTTKTIVCTPIGTGTSRSFSYA